MKKIILLILVVLLTGCGIKKVEMNHYEIDKIPYMFPLKYKQSNESNDYYHCYQLDKNNKITLDTNVNKISYLVSTSKKKYKPLLTVSENAEVEIIGNSEISGPSAKYSQIILMDDRKPLPNILMAEV